jgi:probable rRNA maturation factor
MNAARPVAIANRHPRLRLDRRSLTRAIHTLDANLASFRPSARFPSFPISKVSSFPLRELSLVFLTDAALAKLHADFLADPAATDVITFAGDPAHGTAGEICISADAALRHLRPLAPHRASSALRLPPSAFRISASALSAELTLYVIHGWLHLAGFDDLQPAKKRQMRRAEARALRLLQAAGALPCFSLRH